MRMRTAVQALAGIAFIVATGGCSGAYDPATADTLAVRPIGQLQGSGPHSPLLDQKVRVQGVVTGNFVAGLQGFFMQDAVGEDDGDPRTSDGIFVSWTQADQPKVRRGDRVRVEGSVTELERGGSQQTA